MPGTFAPSTAAGKCLVVALGLPGIILTTSCLGILVASLDVLIERLAVWSASPRHPPTDAALFRRKLLLASVLLSCTMLTLAGFGVGHCGPSAPSSFGDVGLAEGIYFAFQTLSTVGLGDIYCGDLRIIDAVVQVRVYTYCISVV